MLLDPSAGPGDDRGDPNPLLSAALASYAAGGADVEVLAALSHARVLVPLVATLGEAEVGPHGLTQEKSADVSVVLFQRPDGRKALVAFTSLAAMTAWDPQARPRALGAQEVAAAALGEGADALLLDLAGPVRFAVETHELSRFAAGHVMAHTDGGYLWLEHWSG